MVGWLMLLDENLLVIRSSILCFDVGGWLNNCFWVIVRVFFICILRFGILVLLIVWFMFFWLRNLLKCIMEGCGEFLYIIILILLFWGDIGNKWEICFIKFIILVVCWVLWFLEEEELFKIILRWILLYFKGKNISNDIILI